MEVIIAFTKDDDFTLLQRTAEAWDQCEDAEVCLIQVGTKKRPFELSRRIAAEHAAHGKFYILADLGCVPVDKNLGRLNVMPEGFAIMGLWPEEARCVGHICARSLGECAEGKCEQCDAARKMAEAPTGVRLIRRGVVTKWVPKQTDTYDKEHADAARLASFHVGICEDVAFKRLHLVN